MFTLINSIQIFGSQFPSKRLDLLLVTYKYRFTCGFDQVIKFRKLKHKIAEDPAASDDERDGNYEQPVIPITYRIKEVFEKSIIFHDLLVAHKYTQRAYDKKN